MKYWISYTDNTVDTFEAKTKQEAIHYFMMEGDRAFDYGRYENKEEIPTNPMNWPADRCLKEGMTCLYCERGALVIIGEVYPYSIEHLQCPLCDSTYTLSY